MAGVTKPDEVAARAKLAELMQERGQVVFRYVDRKGQPLPAANPNGSVNDIAGIVNERGNILGLMPHPEDAIDPLLGSTDGLGLFESILARVAV